MGKFSEALISSSDAVACVQPYLSPFLEPVLMDMVAMALVLDPSVTTVRFGLSSLVGLLGLFFLFPS